MTLLNRKVKDHLGLVLLSALRYLADAVVWVYSFCFSATIQLLNSYIKYMKLLFSITTLKCLFVYDMEDEDEYKMVSRQDLGWYVWYRYTETAITGDDDSPPLVVATAVAAAAADSTLLPIVAEAINLSKFASSTPPTTQQQQAGDSDIGIGPFPRRTIHLSHLSSFTNHNKNSDVPLLWNMDDGHYVIFSILADLLDTIGCWLL